jgi:hypothetical protein
VRVLCRLAAVGDRLILATCSARKEILMSLLFPMVAGPVSRVQAQPAQA